MQTVSEKRKNSASLLIAAALISISICLPLGGCGDNEKGLLSGDEPDTSIAVFRDGVSPYPSYTGARDAAVKNGPAEQLRNLNWGGMESDTIGSRQLSGGNYQKRLFIRFDISGITACEEVLEAFLRLHIIPVSADTAAFSMHRVTVPENIPDSWEEGNEKGEYNAGICWDYATGAAPWDNPGGDYLDPPLYNLSIGADSTVNLAIPPGVVEDWINSPLGNDGIMIKPAYPFIGNRVVYLSENPDPQLRPQLTIRYLSYG